MSPYPPAVDLVVLVADLDMETGVKALLQRANTLGFHTITTKFIRHENRDSGVFGDCEVRLRTQLRTARHALAICDHEGCGRESLSREAIESEMERRLAANGWSNNNARVVVIEPELEAWLWGDWSLLLEESGWPVSIAELRGWLVERRLIAPNGAKPQRPKETIERVLRQANKRASPTLFANMARRAQTHGCVDAAFGKLLSTLRTWFPA
jgi:hypothetical protein